MIIFIPFFLLIISALTIIVLNRLKINVGRVWFLSALFSFITWGLILGYKWLLPIDFTYVNWFPFNEYFPESIALRMDQFSWVFAFALASIQLAIILTDSSRLTELPTLNIWAGIFIINALGYISILANSFLAIFIFWTFIDVVELLIVLLTVNGDEMVNVGVISFAVKITGIMLLMLAVFSSYSQGLSISFTQISGGASLIILASIGLRLGVLPFNLPYMKEIPIRIGLGNTIRMVGVASGLIILIRITQGLSLQQFSSAILLILSLVGLIASIMWLVAKNELVGRPFWIIGLTSFSIISSIQGDTVASLIWSVDLLLVGSCLFLFSEKGKNVLFLPLISILGISGLPFTQSAYGWRALFSEGFVTPTIFNLLSLILLILGSVRIILHPGQDLKLKERWIWIFYPSGLFFIILSHWLIFLLSPFDWMQAGIFWASIPALAFAILIFYIIRRINLIAEYTEWLITLVNRIGDIITSILSLNWFYKTTWYVLRIIQAIVNLISNILEGQTGIIWVLILIAVFITIILPGGK